MVRNRYAAKFKEMKYFSLTGNNLELQLSIENKYKSTLNNIISYLTLNIYSNIRIRRDVKKEDTLHKVQVSSQPQSANNSGVITPAPSQVKSDKIAGSPRGQKVATFDKGFSFEGFKDNLDDNSTTLLQTVDKSDTVINSTLDQKTKEANSTWKVNLG